MIRQHNQLEYRGFEQMKKIISVFLAVLLVTSTAGATGNIQVPDLLNNVYDSTNKALQATVSGVVTPDAPFEITDTNTIYIDINADIEAAIAAATAGDTIVLAAGTYTVTDDIDIAQSINVVGQGIGHTTIACATANKIMIDTSADGVRVANLTLSSTAENTGTTSMIEAGGSMEVESVQFLNAATGGVIGSKGFSASAAKESNIRNCEFVTTGACGWHFAVDNPTAGSTINVYDSIISETAGTQAGLGNICTYSDDGTATINIFNSTITATAALSGGAVHCNDGTTNVYNTNIDSSGGGSFDVLRVSGTLTLYNTTLVNNTTSGTITYGGTVVSNGISGDNVKAGTLIVSGDATAPAGVVGRVRIVTQDGAAPCFIQLFAN